MTTPRPTIDAELTRLFDERDAVRAARLQQLTEGATAVTFENRAIARHRIADLMGHEAELDRQINSRVVALGGRQQSYDWGRSVVLERLPR